MEESMLLAKVFAIYLTGAGLAAAMNIKNLKLTVASFFKNSGLSMFAGAALLLLGSYLVVIHNVWVADWRLIITLLAWLILLKGLVLLLNPAWAEKVSKDLLKQSWLGLAVLVEIVLGLYLAYVSWLM